MQTVTDYQIVTAKMTNTIENFGATIDRLVKDGWQPLGQPFIILDNRWAQINQAMVKYADPLEGYDYGYEAYRRNWEKHKTPDGIKE